MGFPVWQLKLYLAESILHKALKIKARESAWGDPNVRGARKSSSIATFGERT